MGPSETPPLEGLCRGTGSCKARHAVGSRRPCSRPTRQEGQMPAPSVRGLGGRSSQGASVRRRVRASAARRTGAPAGRPCAPGCPRRCQTSAPPAADPRHTAGTPHSCPAGLGSVLRWKTGRSSLPQPGRVGGAASRAQTVASREQGRLAPGPRAAARGCNPFGLIPSTRSNRETAPGHLKGGLAPGPLSNKHE